jgi:putative colanic acid biosynthesis UDP-glucose lipid carrier transferase
MLTIGVNLSALDDFKLLLLYLLATAFSVFLFRTLALTLYRHYRKLPYNSRPSVIVGSNTNGVQLFHYFTENKHLKRDFRGIFANEAPADQQAAQHYKGNLGQLKSYCIDNSIKEIYYTLPEDHQFLDELKDFAESNFIYLGIIPNIKLVYDTRLGTQYFDDGRIAVISYRDTPLRRMINRHMKRAFDIFFASLALLLLIPTVLPLVALAIRLDSKGPIFFRQIRPGLHNRPFWCYKFRTMCVNGEQCRQATKNDSRITRVGSFLRKTSIDELPQFFNVLKGDMSVVGPRPNMVNQLEYYSKHIKDYPVRHTINPGITGYAQISGYRGETKEMHLMQKRIEYDLQYMYNWTLVLDLKIIWRTVLNIIKGEENAY